MALFGASYLPLLFILGSTLYSVSHACRACTNNWLKVYETNDLEEVTFGNLADVADAHKRGAKIRYMIPALEYVEELDYSYSFLGGVCGQSVHHVSKEAWNQFTVDGQWRFVTVCTNGQYEQYEYNVGEPVFNQYSKSKHGIVWFIKDSTCPNPFYSHLSNGNTEIGNKDDLKEYVLAGFDVRGYIEKYGLNFPYHNVQIDEPSGEVVGQTLWPVYLPSNEVAQWWLEMISTNGMDDNQLWNVGEHVSQTHIDLQSPAVWLVEPCWRHVLTHDANGVQLDGLLDDLIAAVKQGHRVKVVMGTYSIEADKIFRRGGQVTAQILSQVSKNGAHTFLDDAFWIWQMVHTGGNIRTRTYSIGDVANRGDTTERQPVSWFVDTRRWTKVLSTNKAGDVTFGTKADLKAKIELGAEVRVSLQTGGRGSEYILMKAENLQFGPGGEIGAELIRSVSTTFIQPNEFQISDNPSWDFMVVTTQSNVDVSKWRVGTHVDDGHNIVQANVNWFVNS